MPAVYPPKLAGLLDDLRMIDDRELRSDLLIEYADKFKPVAPAIAARPYDERHKVPACESEAYGWVTRETTGGIHVHFAVENPQGISAKALAAVLEEGLGGCTPEQVQLVEEDIFDQIFGKALSMGKGTGLRGMVRLVKALARG